MWWGDGKYTFAGKWAPYIAVQGGTESNAGQSFIGKVDSQVFGAQIGANILRGLQFTAGYDQIPWKTDTVNLPSGVTCSNANYQISAKSTLGYFLPLNAAQCFTNTNGTTQIEYGGWASPYTDNYDGDPLFTTSVTQGMVDRRAAGSSEKVGLQLHDLQHEVGLHRDRRVVRLRQLVGAGEHQHLGARRTLPLQPHAGPRSV